MEAYLTDWFSLFFRWFHVITGIAWIGASFYFVWLDNSLEEPPQWKKDKGIKGDLWAIHGGGFYEVAKYRLGPEKMPEHLHWFKWEAYTTWLTGFVLLWIVYYLGADRYLIDATTLALSVPEAIGAGLGFLAAGFIIYEGLLRTPLRYNGLAFGIVLFIVLAVSSYVANLLFSARGAYIHVGALMGSIMAGNVLFGIMPAQRGLVSAVEKGESPDPALGEFAKLRSTHNNYLTLPVLFIMISNHYPMVYAHEYGWALLVAIGGIAAFARHFFNLRHKGVNKPIILVIGAILLAGVAAAIAPTKAPIKPADESFTDTKAIAIFQSRCVTCHSANPTDELFTAPPAGLTLDTLEQVESAGYARIKGVVETGYMPLANRSGMTDEERAAIVGWLSEKGKKGQ
ncbi:hypothetical protein BTA51_27085 [Hahella sp. CCB-MM4]|uniref:urate hydroxylase PuuD n=1 Tax=Hahella sp. (strain CCB-MM4) TaxID=1926491 RepID=UPI000B9BAAE0|nr:urate hydroxylase PuuD [Hahella sp. CCB-MM4]OZG70265.1 hypothetical protein BTA51_27085 [Hahella sp. CCB-MM4]